jgi:hypothetical protein
MDEIFRSDKILEFWPRANQSAKDRVNATARFVIYASCIIYLIQRDPRIFALGALVLGALLYMNSRGMIASGGETFMVPGAGFVRPTTDNSMGNVLLTDYVDRPDRKSAAWYDDVAGEVKNAWAKIHPFDQDRGKEKKLWQYDASSRFYSMPVTTIPGDQTGFAEAMYGKKNAPFCKDGSGLEFCAPDEGFMGRTHFPEQVQMRAGNGRNS